MEMPSETLKTEGRRGTRRLRTKKAESNQQQSATLRVLTCIHTINDFALSVSNRADTCLVFVLTIRTTPTAYTIPTNQKSDPLAKHSGGKTSKLWISHPPPSKESGIFSLDDML